MKIRRCPKCHKKPIFYTEFWTDLTIEFDAVNGIPEKEGEIPMAGKPYKVEATCECGYSWTLRGIMQITELTPD